MLSVLLVVQSLACMSLKAVAVCIPLPQCLIDASADLSTGEKLLNSMSSSQPLTGSPYTRPWFTKGDPAYSVNSPGLSAWLTSWLMKHIRRMHLHTAPATIPCMLLVCCFVIG